MDRKSAVCMDKNGKDTKHNRNISGGIHCVRNGNNCKMHNIEWRKQGIQLADIETKNVRDNDLNHRM